MNLKNTSIQAIILAGGKGSRLSAIHPSIPKALVPIEGKPFIQWQLEWLAAHGISSIHLAMGHLAEAILRWVESNPIHSISISSSSESYPSGTAGGLKSTEPFIISDPFLVINGDSLLPNLDFHKLISAHQTNNSIITLAITRIQSSARYGTVEFDHGGRITAFQEKAERDEGWINSGVYVARHDVFSHIPSDTIQSLETDIFPKLALTGQLSAFKTPPPLLDMGTPEGMKVMESYLLSREV